jgi:hypothetical protein
MFEKYNYLKFLITQLLSTVFCVFPNAVSPTYQFIELNFPGDTMIYWQNANLSVADTLLLMLSR